MIDKITPFFVQVAMQFNPSHPQLNKLLYSFTKLTE